MNLKQTAIMVLVATIIILILIANHPLWYSHLHTDVNVYFARAIYFLKNGSFAGLVGNEYQPGALLFFLALGPILLINNTFQVYLWTLFSANILLILLLAYLYKNYSDIKNVFLFALILLFTGPIVLFRFDLYVMAVLILSFYFWKRNLQLVATTALAYASFIKIFPVIFLPYYLIMIYCNQGLKRALALLSVFVISYISYVAIFSFVTGMTIHQIINGFSFIANTPVHAESLWATLITLFWKITDGEFARGAGAWGIFGIAPEFQIGPLWFYNYFWVVPLLTLYLVVFPKIKKSNVGLDIRILMAIVLLFLMFSKIVHHQYTLWLMLLLPLLDLKIFLKGTWLVNLILILVMTAINQYVYPLNYSEWMFGFYTTGSHSHIFWIVALRNSILILLLLRILQDVRAVLDEKHKLVEGLP